MAILCFGELLWDCLPRGLFLGGAPMNVAYHLVTLGRRALPVSALGDDFLGQEARRRLARAGLDDRFVGTVDAPTGVVLVELQDGQPRYEIVDDVAWDRIPGDADLLEHAAEASALVFGSLAARRPANHRLLLRLLDSCPGQCVLDVNLRPPYDDLDLVRELAARSHLVKLNHEELARLIPAPHEDLEGAARALSRASGGADVAVTAGARGAGLLRAQTWHWQAGRPVAVADTVGAGDSFTAALIDGLLTGAAPPEALRRACRLAEHVAATDGAMPVHPATL